MKLNKNGDLVSFESVLLPPTRSKVSAEPIWTQLVLEDAAKSPGSLWEATNALLYCLWNAILVCCSHKEI